MELFQVSLHTKMKIPDSQLYPKNISLIKYELYIIINVYNFENCISVIVVPLQYCKRTLKNYQMQNKAHFCMERVTLNYAFSPFKSHLFGLDVFVFTVVGDYINTMKTTY